LVAVAVGVAVAVAVAVAVVVAVAVAVVVGFAFAAFVLIIRSIRPRSPPALYWAQFVPLAVMTGATAESWGMA
jgi:Na+-transporting NADH:ubiquinone oxidoreductase subunit NqrD